MFDMPLNVLNSDRENDKMDRNSQLWINYLSIIYPDLQKPCYNAGEVNKKVCCEQYTFKSWFLTCKLYFSLCDKVLELRIAAEKMSLT